MIRALAALLLLGGCTVSAETQQAEQATARRDLAEAVQGRVAGKPVDCIDSTRAGGPQVIDGSTLVYRDMGTVYVNTLPAACPSLRRDDSIAIEVHGSQICRNDRFRSLEPGLSIAGPYCMLGKFTPYRKPKR